MATWEEFARAEPAMAAHGERLLLLGLPPEPVEGGFAGGLAYLATVRRDGGPRLHPISPVLHQGRLYAFVLKVSPKKRDLLDNGRYALHSWPTHLSEQFTVEEFFVAGRATLVTDPAIRQAVADGCGDPVETGEVFELAVERALHREPRNQGGRPVYHVWRAMSDER